MITDYGDGMEKKVNDKKNHKFNSRKEKEHLSVP